MTDYAKAYADSRERIQALVGALPAEELAWTVPACPKWTIKELVAHLTGVAVDTQNLNIEDAGQAGWTQKQVETRRDEPLADIFEEWNAVAARIEAGLNDVHPTVASMLIGDSATHELDLRGALGNTEQRDNEGVVIAASFYARNFGKRLKDAGLPTVIVQCGEHEWTAGREQPQGHVRAPLFEMLRGLTGRRTLDEIKGFDWTIGAAPFLELFAMYPVTETSLNE